MSHVLKGTLHEEIERTPLNRLMLRYAIPPIISAVVGALYNIVDQVFIGHIVGVEGNAATNVTFPFVTLVFIICNVFGVGGTANFSLAMGRKDGKAGERYLGTTLTTACGTALMLSLFAVIYADFLLQILGATQENFGLARTYLRITAVGNFFLIMAEVGAHFIRADGSPKYAMVCSLTGVLLNCVLNPLYMIGFHMGIEGAAWATVTGQIVACLMVLRYFFRFKNVSLTLDGFLPKLTFLKDIFYLGMPQSVTITCIMLTQIILNNALGHYGALSAYGTEIPLACAGISVKVASIYYAIMAGMAHGAQPLLGYAYGAKSYGLVRTMYMRSILWITVVSVVAFLFFQLFPRQILTSFGAENELYLAFGEKYLRIFMGMTFLNGIQPITGSFLALAGKPGISAGIAFAKEVFVLIPLIFLLPLYFQLDGVLYACPIADVFAFSLTVFFVRRELGLLRQKTVLQ